MREVTDIYLLALAVRRGGRLVTFDGGIAREVVRGASLLTPKIFSFSQSRSAEKLNDNKVARQQIDSRAEEIRTG